MTGNGTLPLLCVLQTECWFVDVYYERRSTQRLDHQCYVATVEYLVYIGGILEKEQYRWHLGGNADAHVWNYGGNACVMKAASSGLQNTICGNETINSIAMYAQTDNFIRSSTNNKLIYINKVLIKCESVLIDTWRHVGTRLISLPIQSQHVRYDLPDIRLLCCFARIKCSYIYRVGVHVFHRPYACICICMHMYMHAYIYTYMHTCIHT